MDSKLVTSWGFAWWLAVQYSAEIWEEELITLGLHPLLHQLVVDSVRLLCGDDLLHCLPSWCVFCHSESCEPGLYQ